MHKTVLEHFAAADYKLPPSPAGEKLPGCDLGDKEAEYGAEGTREFGPALIEEERFWLSWECIHRYLRATKWKPEQSIERLEATLRWRRAFGMYDLVNRKHVEPEGLTGKSVLYGYDTQHRPALYLLPSKQNTDESPRQIHFTFWFLERTIELMGPGVESLALLINFGERGRHPSMRTSMTVLSILQEHYPERLGRALVIRIPFLVSAFLKMIMPFVDPVTRDKIRLNPSPVKEGLFAAEEIMTDAWGGKADFEWKHEEYWPALNNMCDARRERWLKAWRELGGRVGVKEWDYKTKLEAGGTPVGDSATSAVVPEQAP
ncbi:CRAL-TRIO domain-containing protein [Schizophyllum amplum]|uniref:CRAL-TRIO domain-containing protein n=1 Tax=Schizophyllum amplum TaxID=97359 RepID=A0A550CHZ3_9AGAR|nr:CRAL-TRIO domain-containing protein [Auriculariopsis ampla]